MPSERKAEQLLIRLTKATIEKELQWKFSDAPRSLTEGTEDIIQSYMEGVYKGQRVGTYERRYQWYDGDHDASYWTSEVKVVLLDEDDEVLWENEEASFAANQLFVKARENAGGVNDIFKKLLADE